MAHLSAPVEFEFSIRRALLSLAGLAVVALVVFALLTYMALTNPQARSRVVGERAFTAETAVLVAGDVAQAIEVSGIVQPARQVDLRPLTNGQIAFVNPNLRDGGQVAAGETLIEIAPASFELSLRQAQNALKDAQASADRLAADVTRQAGQVALQQQQVRLAEAELARRQSLRDQGIITQGTFEQVQTTTLAQRQSQASAQNALAQLEEQLAASATQLDTARINVDLAEKALAETRLTAPFDGLVVQSAVQQGQLASQGDLAARLLDTSGLEVQFTLPSPVFATLSRLDTDGPETGVIGRTVAVRWPGQISDAPVQGPIVRQGSTFDAASSGVPLFAALGPEAFAAGLRPGAFVTVALTGQTFGQVYAIPREAYFEGLGETGGIYIAVERPLVELPEWQGPTDQRTVGRASAWFADQPSEGLDALTPPKWLADADGGEWGKGGVETVADLFVCKPSHLLGQRPNRVGTGRPQGRGDDSPETDQPETDQPETTNPETEGEAGTNETVGGGNQPLLTRDQARALCPLGTQAVATVQPAVLLAYAGDQALITGAGLSGVRAVTQAFDALAVGTWLTLPTGPHGAGAAQAKDEAR